MTDQRARALIARYDLVDVTRCGEGWREMQRDDQYGDWVSYEDHIAALADERRRVWEEAAKDCRYQSRVYSGGELMKRNVLLNMADFFDAKAHAGQEG